MRWHDLKPSPEHSRFLPQIRTDAILSGEARTIIVDTKDVLEALKSNYSGHLKVQSEYLYQILSYETNLSGALDHPVEGLLL